MRRPVGALALALAFAAVPTVGCGGSDAQPQTVDAFSPSASSDAAIVTTQTQTQMTAATAAATRARRIAALRPPIVHKPIPLPERRRRETVRYAERHYAISSAKLQGPRTIVMHYTVTRDFPSTYAVFAPDEPDVELHELPGLCSQFVVDRDGTIYQLTPVTFMCRHTVGLNYTAVGIEHVGSSDREILDNATQLRASLRLTRWLRCRSRIAVKHVIGHNESLSSPYHRENVARLRTQTHGDWKRADMRIYRRKLGALGSCPR